MIRIPFFLLLILKEITVGPKEVNSIQELNKNSMAVIVDNISELNDNIENLLDGGIEVHTIQENAYNYLVQDRVIKVIQEGIFRRIKNTVNNN